LDEPISFEIVTETWQRMADTPLEKVHELVFQMEQEQPQILAYLLAQDEEIFDENEREIILYLGIVVWQILRRSRRQPRKVSQKKLLQAEESNYTFLEQLAGDTEADFMSATLAMIEHHPEPEVFRYIVEALMDEESYDEDDQPIRDENRGLAFLTLKTALDALISSRPGPGKRGQGPAGPKLPGI
jgi:hypothetical protein